MIRMIFPEPAVLLDRRHWPDQTIRGGIIRCAEEEPHGRSGIQADGECVVAIGLVFKVIPHPVLALMLKVEEVLELANGFNECGFVPFHLVHFIDDDATEADIEEGNQVFRVSSHLEPFGHPLDSRYTMVRVSRDSRFFAVWCVEMMTKRSWLGIAFYVFGYTASFRSLFLLSGQK